VIDWHRIEDRLSDTELDMLSEYRANVRALVEYLNQNIPLLADVAMSADSVATREIMDGYYDVVRPFQEVTNGL
jgi:hypothetical protein